MPRQLYLGIFCFSAGFVYRYRKCTFNNPELDLPKLTELTNPFCQVLVSFLSTHSEPICAILKSQQTDSAPLSRKLNKNISEVQILKHYNDFLIVGIDHGYGNIKTANTVTPTGITKLDAAPTFTKNTLFFDGNYYQIGEGHKEYLADKWQDEDNYIFTLMGIARELNREGITSAKIYLAVGLPITWVGRQREDFRKYMLQRGSVDFKYEDKLYSVRIIGCYVYPQGYAAVVEKLNEMTGLSMIADIGNGTVNIIFVSNKRVLNTKTYTEKMGVNQCVKAASNAMMNKFGVTVDESIIQSMIRYGKADIDSEYADVLRQAIAEYAEDIFALLRKYEYDPKMMRLYITGGGGKLIENFGSYDKDRVTIIEDIKASAKGYEYFAVAQLKKEEKK